MRAAPACALTLRSGRLERGLLVALIALCAASLGAWLSDAWASWHGPWAWPAGARGLAALSAATLGIVGWSWHRRRASAAQPPPVDLRWDGAAWTWSGEPVLLELALDLGPWLLIRARPVAARRGAWRWACAAQWRCSPAGWHAMRVAWQAHAGGSASALHATPHRGRGDPARSVPGREPAGEPPDER